jgi:hypothetical protein
MTLGSAFALVESRVRQTVLRSDFQRFTRTEATNPRNVAVQLTPCPHCRTRLSPPRQWCDECRATNAERMRQKRAKQRDAARVAAVAYQRAYFSQPALPYQQEAV